MEAIPTNELYRLPFVDKPPTDGRRVLLQPYFDTANRDWHLYFEVEPGKLGRIAGGEPVYGGYLSRDIADRNRDIELPFVTLITQHLSFPKVHGRLRAIESDFHQCAAVLEKYRLLWQYRPASGLHTSFLIASELEYLLLLIRSLYDLVHAVVAKIAGLLVVLDGSNRKIAKQLPESFRAVAMQGNELRSGDDIVATYKLPPALANWYVAEAPAFRELRRLRDGIAHHGRTVPTLFELPEGLALDASDSMWSEFLIWPSEMRINGKFGSVRALFAALVLNAVSATTRLDEALRACVQLPDAIGTDVRSFLRSPFGAQLVRLLDILAAPWEGRESA